ncbi:MAG: hypothetical protein ABSB79_06055 [Syntrophales bacterium]
MPPSGSFFKKTIPLTLALIMIHALVAFALDQYDDDYSPNCPICIAKHLLNGSQNSIVVNFYPSIAYHYPDEQLFGITVPTILSFKDRAPPEPS